MKMICFFLCLTLVFCNNCDKKDTGTHSTVKIKNKMCNAGIFNNADSSGSVIGVVQNIEDTSSMSGNVIIVLKDRDSKERYFFASYSTVDDLKIAKLKKGVCVRVEYLAEIQREEGIEVNRIFYVKSIEYL